MKTQLYYELAKKEHFKPGTLLWFRGGHQFALIKNIPVLNAEMGPTDWVIWVGKVSLGERWLDRDNTIMTLNQREYNSVITTRGPFAISNAALYYVCVKPGPGRIPFPPNHDDLM